MERHHFEEELQALKNRLLTMGALVEERVHQAVRSLIDRRLDEAEAASDAHKRVDDVDSHIDHGCLELLTYMIAVPVTMQRALAVIMINRNIERIADHAANVAEDVIFLVEAKDVRHH